MRRAKLLCTFTHCFVHQHKTFISSLVVDLGYAIPENEGIRRKYNFLLSSKMPCIFDEQEWKGGNV